MPNFTLHIETQPSWTAGLWTGNTKGMCVASEGWTASDHGPFPPAPDQTCQRTQLLAAWPLVPKAPPVRNWTPTGWNSLPRHALTMSKETWPESLGAPHFFSTDDQKPSNFKVMCCCYVEPTNQQHKNPATNAYEGRQWDESYLLMAPRITGNWLIPLEGQTDQIRLELYKFRCRFCITQS